MADDKAMQTTNGGGQVARYQDRVNDFRELIGKLKPQLSLALPRHVKVERLARVVLTSVQRTPALLDCTRESLLGCIMQAAQLGLEPDGLLGHAYLIPYGKTCTLIIGYKGMLKLARQSGELLSISAHAVYEADAFKYRFGLNERLIHRPAIPPEGAPDDWTPGELVAVYAVAKLKGGAQQFDVMHRREVDLIRKRSRASNNGPWVTDYAEMAKKTVLRRICKMLPSSVEMSTAIALDERADANIDQALDNPIELPPERPAEIPADQQGRRMPLGAAKTETKTEAPKPETKSSHGDAKAEAKGEIKTERVPGEDG